MSSCAVRCAKDFRKVNAGVSVPELCLVSIDSLYMIYKYSTIHDKYHHGIYFVKQHKRRYYMYHLHVPLFRLHVHVFHDITLFTGLQRPGSEAYIQMGPGPFASSCA